jgi:two-component system sensor histidine kinase UhpB
MHSKSAADRFARRMLPMAVLAGAVVAAVPPLSWRTVTWQRLGAQARVYATHVAHGVARAARLDPYLWRYNAGKVVQAAALHRGQSDIAAVRIAGCTGETLFDAQGLGVGTGKAGGVSGRAPIVTDAGTVAWVEVHADEREARRALVRIAAGSGALGLVVALLLFLFPTRVVRRLAADVAATVARLGDAERVVGVQEEERRRIARDLHDGVGQSLAALRLELEMAAARPGEAAAHLAAGAARCEETVAELRRVVHDLKPPELGTLGAAEALRACTERFERSTGIAVSFRHEGGDVASVERATCLLRILQEALHNVAAHAGAREVGVTLVVDGAGAVTLAVRDDGRGFEVAAARRGMGLDGIAERCAFLGGTFELESRPGEGTRLVARLPGTEVGS